MTVLADLAIRRPEELTLVPRPGTPGRVHDVTLPYTTPPLSANDRHGGDINASGGTQAFYIVERRKQQAVAKVVATAVRAARWPVIEGRVEALLVYYLRNNGWADSDNIAPTMKPALDALRPPTRSRPYGLGLIPEDHSGVVRQTAQAVVQKAEDPTPERGPRLRLLLVEVA